MTPKQLAALREELRTQDNASTAHPLFVVYDVRIDGKRAHLNSANWRFVTACLTKKAAERFIVEYSHRLHKPFVYVDTLYGNDEMLALRNHLMGDTP